MKNRTFVYSLFLLIIFFFGTSKSWAIQTEIPNFKVKPSLLNNGKLAIIACDSLENPLERIKGNYTFSVSGFTQTISFQEGIGILPLVVDKSTFIYIKHENGDKVASKLVYVLKSENKGQVHVKPFTISRIWLLIIPGVLILLIFAFKRFIYIGIIILVIYLYLNHQQGLSFGTMIESFFDYFRALI